MLNSNELSISKKQQFGQFFTTNSDYILNGFNKYIFGKNVCDPFAGNGDLLVFAKNNGANSVIGYDIDNNLVDNLNIFYNDSLENPQKYDFVLTNPPYLYQNKINIDILKNSKHTDLYQLSLEKIMDSNEGIVIVPINFLSAENSKYIRNIFLNKFDIIDVNYFTNSVFDDTTYNVMAFYYTLKKNKKSNYMDISFNIFPNNKNICIRLFGEYNWQIGGEFLYKINKYNNDLKIKRLLKDDIIDGNYNIKVALNHLKNTKEINVDKKTFDMIQRNIILLKAIDTGSSDGYICLEDIRNYNLNALISLESSRNQIYLILPNYVSIQEQEKIINLFNVDLEKERNKYFSLFMTNFRDNNRKRISFNFAYNFINFIYYSKIKGVKCVEEQYSLF